MRTRFWYEHQGVQGKYKIPKGGAVSIFGDPNYVSGGSLKKVARSRNSCCARMLNPFVSQRFLCCGTERWSVSSDNGMHRGWCHSRLLLKGDKYVEIGLVLLFRIFKVIQRHQFFQASGVDIMWGCQKMRKMVQHSFIHSAIHSIRQIFLRAENPRLSKTRYASLKESTCCYSPPNSCA